MLSENDEIALRMLKDENELICLLPLIRNYLQSRNQARKVIENGATIVAEINVANLSAFDLAEAILKISGIEYENE